MKILYTPEGEPEQQFVFKQHKVLSVEAELIEEVGGRSWETWAEFMRLLAGGQVKARRAALWIMLKRQNPKLRFVDLVVGVDEVDIDYDDDEKAEMRARILADEDLDDTGRRQALDAFGLEPEPVDEPEVEPGKDEPAASSTDSP